MIGHIPVLYHECLDALMPKEGKLLERKVVYVADFVYNDQRTCERVVEDTKGVKTKDYIIKRKLMLYIHHIKIKEI
jgi:hypothetical protein